MQYLVPNYMYFMEQFNSLICMHGPFHNVLTILLALMTKRMHRFSTTNSPHLEVVMDLVDVLVDAFMMKSSMKEVMPGIL